MELVRWTQNFAAMFLLPLVTIVVVSVATSVTVWVLKRAKEWETAANKLETPKRSAKVTLIRMLVTVSIIYVVINTTSLILSIARFHWHETFRIGGKYHNTFMALHMSYWTLGSVNSAVNFFVYALRSYRFRNDCVKLLPKCLQARAIKAFGIETSLISRDVEQSTSNPNKSVFTKFTSVFSVQSTLHDTPVDCGTPVRPGILTDNEEQLHRGKKISVTFVNIREGIRHDVDFALSKGTCQNPALSPVEDMDNSLRSPEPVANAIPPTDIGEKIGSTEQDFAKIGTLDLIPEVPMKRIASSSVEQDLSSMALDCIPEMPLKRIASSSVEPDLPRKALDCIPEVKVKRTASSSVEPGLPRIDEGSNYERSDTNKAAAQSGMAFINIRDDLDIEDKIGATEQDACCIPEVQMKRIASSSVESDHSWMPEGSNDEKSDISKAAKQSSMDKSIVDEKHTPKEKLSVVSSGTDYNPSEYSGEVTARTRNRTISIIEVVFSEESTTDIPA